MKRQATKANHAQIELDIERKRQLGEAMIGDDDQPTGIEFAVTGLIMLAAIASFWWFW